MQESAIGRGPAARGTLGRILVVEDERVIARDLAATLVNLGYDVVGTTATGEDAVEKARTLAPNLVLMDIHLAGSIDGIRAAEMIREKRDLPVIYLTAYSDEETLRRAKGTEPQGYLVKPFKTAELRCAIEIALHKHEIEARLRERERWLTTTLRSIGAALLTTDPSKNVSHLNPVAEALTGWTQDVSLRQAIEQIPRLLGEARDSAAPIIGDEGSALGGVRVFRDVTEQRRSADEVLRSNEAFEQRVSERTAVLEAANRELESFSFSVAHDLRAPLRGIDGFSQLLIEDHAANLGPDGVDHLRRIRATSQRMSRLIDDLLRLSRVARSELAKQAVDLSHLATAVSSELQAAQPERDVDWVITEGILVQGDENLLRILVQNLLGNAWKFTAKIDCARIECGQIEPDRVYFVRDNGAGFSMEHSDQLFGAFQRLHSESEFSGTGIGLTIAQRIVDRHGGLIWAESTVGQGATFYFTV